MILTVLLFILILAVLILVHELGHFIVAKRAGAKVEEFGIGFPPRVFSIKRGETAYSFNLFPIGGFVKIYGEDGGEKEDQRSFASKKIHVRALILFAGVLMNVCISAVLFSFGHFLGFPEVVEGEVKNAHVRNIQVRIVEVAKLSPAETAGIKVGESIVRVQSGEEQIRVHDIEDVQKFTNRHLGEEIILSLAVKNGSIVRDVRLRPREFAPKEEGAIGIAMVKVGVVSYPFYRAPFKGIETTYHALAGTVHALFDTVVGFVRSGKLNESLSGPVGIAIITAEVQKMGFMFLLQFIALISVNLAVLNILPFPALDGGRLLFLAIEKIKGSPVKQRYEKMAHSIGFMVLIILMILITFRDVERLL
ncbi:MAG: RIP metalloprotease RseP [Candidatus Spechtbacteria bacterium]|nr:RIP metalloprotease RseP [Candidatus Spechtbacteria bacterium]